MENLIIKYYKSLNTNEKKDFRMIVCQRCGLEYYSFMRRINNNSWSILERKELEKIMDELKK